MSNLTRSNFNPMREHTKASKPFYDAIRKAKKEQRKIPSIKDLRQYWV